MTIINVATAWVCINCGEYVYSTQHEGWPKPKWWHHDFIKVGCRLESAKGKIAEPVKVLVTWSNDRPWSW